ncbi:MAG: LysR family transcriptional regulator [Proteobacteria bacterium]|nr:LysR family transcriptional regulator [Pseudomonadota bacterium]MBU1739999.1 LysR family transcriptional regulator [Pseudomonadota bacterium]
MDLKRLEVFVKVVEHKSFSRAAEEVLLSQPTISGHIKYLEETLAVQLLDRLGREVTPTRAGLILYDHARVLLAHRDRAVMAIDEFVGQMRGELVCGGSTIPGQYLLPALLGRFRESYPEVMVRLVIGDTDAVIDGVARGELETGVVGAPVDDDRLASAPLGRDELVLVVPPGHSWANREAVDPTELPGQPFLQREVGSGTRRSVERALREAGVNVSALDVVAQLGSTEAVRQGVKAGLGLAMVSKLAVAEDAQRGALFIVPVRGVDLRRRFYNVWHLHRACSPLCRAWLEFVTSELAD